MRWAAPLLAFALAGCPMAEPRAPRCDPADPASCPEGMACDVDPAGGHGCVERCDVPHPVRCENGAHCNSYIYVEPNRVCSLGGTAGPGEFVDVLAGEECVFGYAYAIDYTVDEFRVYCAPVCNDVEDCPVGTDCRDFVCRSSCMELGSCGPGNYCYAGVVCVNERTWLSIDCDGDLLPECRPGFHCGTPPDEPECVRGRI